MFVQEVALTILGRNDWKTETIGNDKRFIISVKWRTGWVHKIFWIIQFWSPFLGFEMKWSLTYYIKMLGYFTTYRFAVKARSWLLCMYKIQWPRIQLQKTRLAVFVCFFVFRICLFNFLFYHRFELPDGGFKVKSHGEHMVNLFLFHQYFISFPHVWSFMDMRLNSRFSNFSFLIVFLIRQFE